MIFLKHVGSIVDHRDEGVNVGRECELPNQLFVNIVKRAYNRMKPLDLGIYWFYGEAELLPDVLSFMLGRHQDPAILYSANH